MCSQKYLAFNVILFCFCLLIIPAIILLSLSPRENVVANTQGYIVPGGDCQIICGETGDYDGCQSVGIINVSFYFPEISSQLFSGLTKAPAICDFETADKTICCQEFIEDQSLLWIQVEIINGNFNVIHVSINRVNNYSTYLFLGLILIGVGSLLGIALVCNIVHMIKQRNNQSYITLN